MCNSMSLKMLRIVNKPKQQIDMHLRLRRVVAVLVNKTSENDF